MILTHEINVMKHRDGVTPTDIFNAAKKLWEDGLEGYRTSRTLQHKQRLVSHRRNNLLQGISTLKKLYGDAGHTHSECAVLEDDLYKQLGTLHP